MNLSKEMIEVLTEVNNKGENLNFNSRVKEILELLKSMGLVGVSYIHGQVKPWTCEITSKGKNILKQKDII